MPMTEGMGASVRFKETQEKVDQVASWTNDSITQNACLQVLL